eukprot:3137586-Amphidinium_carterae.1
MIKKHPNKGVSLSTAENRDCIKDPLKPAYCISFHLYLQSPHFIEHKGENRDCKTKTQDPQKTPINALTCVAFNDREQRRQIVTPFSLGPSNDQRVVADLPSGPKPRQSPDFGCGWHHLVLVHEQDVEISTQLQSTFRPTKHLSGKRKFRRNHHCRSAG